MQLGVFPECFITAETADSAGVPTGFRGLGRTQHIFFFSFVCYFFLFLGVILALGTGPEILWFFLLGSCSKQAIGSHMANNLFPLTCTSICLFLFLPYTKYSTFAY